MRLWGWAAAAGASLLAVLLLVMGQRDKARRQLSSARGKLKTSQSGRAADQAAREAQASAQQHTAEVQREADDRPDDRRPSGHLRR